MRTILLLLAIGIGVVSLLVAAYMGTHPAARLGLQTQHLLSAAAWAVGGLTAAGLLAAAAAALGLLRQIRDQHRQAAAERPQRQAAPAFGATSAAGEAPAAPRLRTPALATDDARAPAGPQISAEKPLPRL